MGDENKEQTTAVAKGKKGFQPGHPKYGGRQKGSINRVTWAARELAERHGFHPMKFLMDAVTTGTIPGPDGKGTLVLSADERLKSARDLMRYVMPTLSAVQVTGQDNGPIQTASVDLTELMKNPEMAAAAQKLAAGMIEADKASRDPRNWDEAIEVSGEVLTDEDED